MLRIDKAQQVLKLMIVAKSGKVRYHGCGLANDMDKNRIDTF